MSQIQQFFNDFGPIGESILNILAALAILIIGYIIARIAAKIVRRLLNRTSLDEKLAEALTIEESSTLSIEEIVGRAVFWIIMLFTAVGVLQRLQLPAVADPINSLLNKVTTQYLPNLGGAILTIILALAVATIVRFLIIKATDLLKVDERLTQHGALEEGENVSVSQSIATAVYWFIFLLFLPSVLSRLGMSEIAAPVQAMFSQAIAYVPNIVGAGLILLIGWFVARILRQILTNLLAAIGADALGEKAGLTGTRSLSNLIGTVVYTFVLLFTIISALEELSIEAISGPATTMLTTILDAVPGIFGATLVLIVSYYIARLVAGLISDLLTGFGVNELPAKLGINLTGTRTMSQLIGYIIQVGIMLFAAISAAELLGSQFLANIITTFVGFAGQVILALVIFGIGLYLANLAHNVIKSAGGAQSQMTATIARMAILVLAGAMGLRQMGIADDIVNLTFGILLGALGVAAALAFGLGSREIAGKEVARLIDNIRSGE